MILKHIVSPTLTAAAALSLAVLLSGCRIETSKHSSGKGDDVKLDTPFGGMQVKTDNAAVVAGIGLPVYPGATLIKKKQDGKDKDDGSADIDMSFGSFKMRIKAVSYHSADSQDKIIAFYRPALAKYGDIIECDHDRPVGTPTRTSQGLTCDSKKGNHISVEESSSGNIELKTGSEQHQHVVGIDHDGDGTKIGLVSLDLPGHMSFGSDAGDNDKQ